MKQEIEFTVDEARALMQLIHFAVQAKGMEVAEASVILSKKIQDAFREDMTPNMANTPQKDKAA